MSQRLNDQHMFVSTLETARLARTCGCKCGHQRRAQVFEQHFVSERKSNTLDTCLVMSAAALAACGVAAGLLHSSTSRSSDENVMSWMIRDIEAWVGPAI